VRYFEIYVAVKIQIVIWVMTPYNLIFLMTFMYEIIGNYHAVLDLIC